MTSTWKTLIGALVISGIAAGVATANEAVKVVGQYKAAWGRQPGRTPANHSVDGPLMGNGV